MPWPQTPDGPGPIRLELLAEESDSLRPPEVIADEGRILVYVPHGARVTAEISSMLATPHHMALPAMWADKLDDEARREADAIGPKNRS